MLEPASIVTALRTAASERQQLRTLSQHALDRLRALQAIE